MKSPGAKAAKWSRIVAPGLGEGAARMTNPEPATGRSTLYQDSRFNAGGRTALSGSKSKLAWANPLPGDSSNRVYSYFAKETKTPAMAGFDAAPAGTLDPVL